jgi:hypothetical protein
MKGAQCTLDVPWAAGGLTSFQHTTYAAPNTPDACYNRKCKSQVQALLGNAPAGLCGSASSIAVATLLVFAFALFVLMF